MPGYVIRVYANIAVVEEIVVEDAENEQDAKEKAESEVEFKLAHAGHVSIVDSDVEEVLP